MIMLKREKIEIMNLLEGMVAMKISAYGLG
jgi:hypothetical protein